MEGPELLEKYRKLIMEGEDGDMENFEKTYIKFLEDNYKRGKNEGISQGISQTLIKIAKEMLKIKMKDEDILKVTNLSKEQLKELKMQKV